MAREWLQDTNGQWRLWSDAGIEQMLPLGASPPNDGIPKYWNQEVPNDFQQTIGAEGGGVNWWDQSIFADLVGGTSTIGADSFNFGTGFMGFGVGSGPQLPKLPWLWILAGVGIVVVAVSARR